MTTGTERDLLGDALPETPAMTAPLPWRVYRMNDTDWMMATSLPEAMGQYLIQTGCSAEDAFDGERELTDEEMDRLKYIFWLEGPQHPPIDHKCSFREELARRVSRGPKPEIFASTEY